MITKKTEGLLNELIQGMTRSAINAYNSGATIESSDIEALASLVSSVQGDGGDLPPICGFIVPPPREEEDQQEEGE